MPCNNPAATGALNSQADVHRPPDLSDDLLRTATDTMLRLEDDYTNNGDSLPDETVSEQLVRLAKGSSEPARQLAQGPRRAGQPWHVECFFEDLVISADCIVGVPPVGSGCDIVVAYKGKLSILALAVACLAAFHARDVACVQTAADMQSLQTVHRLQPSCNP